MIRQVGVSGGKNITPTVSGVKTAPHPPPYLFSFIIPDYIMRPRTDAFHLPPPAPLLSLAILTQEQETDNSGTYGGQEAMQINVSQRRVFFLALRNLCRKEAQGPTEHNWVSAD